MDVRTFGDISSGDPALVFNAAYAALTEARGGEIEVPGGDYILQTPILVSGNEIALNGRNPSATRFIYTGPGAAIQNSDPTQLRRRLSFRNFTIDNLGTSGSGGIRYESFYDSLTERVQFESPGAGAYGAEFYGTVSTYFNTLNKCYFSLPRSGSTGIKWTAGAQTPNSSRIRDCYTNCATGAVALDMPVGSTGGNNHIMDNEFTGNGGTTTVFGGNYNNIIGNSWDGANANTILVSGSYNRFASNTNNIIFTWVETGVGNQFAEDRFINIGGSATFDDASPAYVYFYVPGFTGYSFTVPNAFINTRFRQFLSTATGAVSPGSSTSGAATTHFHNWATSSGGAAGGYALNKYTDGAGVVDFDLGASGAGSPLKTSGEQGAGHTHNITGHSHTLTYGTYEEAYPASHSVQVLVQYFTAGAWSTVQTLAGLVGDSDIMRGIASGITAAGEYRLRFASNGGQPQGGRLVADVSGYVQLRMANG